MKLTIGMATYDDYDGVYFTVQALRMYHAGARDAEFIVIDNNPSGPCREALERLAHHVPNYRYIAAGARAGTAARDRIFAEATGELVLVLDCHVLLAPYALDRLLSYAGTRLGARDLLQGPLLRDDLKSISTHFAPEWRAGMFGTWATDLRGEDEDGLPFEIPLQGLGLFAMRRDAWPGLNSRFHGFGGEEGYIHEKVRRRGGRTLCLPFLRWMHRFQRPLGCPYPNTWEDRVRNYMIGWHELGWPTSEIAAHFRAHLTPMLGAPLTEMIIAQAQAEIAAPAAA